ncbi:BspA family leucine-rich repeat surface protein [Marinicellulosiphila megalodicopiae]|uniref:BspA family leucine-rich repeat surface protein n=1 Tax=Marinicellulosiphila megalodicopiae TaxID=2724896 RepID=UPI003BB1BF08
MKILLTQTLIVAFALVCCACIPPPEPQPVPIPIPENDTTAPVITLLGEKVIELEVYTEFQDPYFFTSDTQDYEITQSVSGEVYTHVLGSYTLTYHATDRSENHALPVTRTVNVVDTTAPIITLNGLGKIFFYAQDEYADLGATVSDNYDKSVVIKTSTNVDSKKQGSYIVSYQAIDSSGNESVIERNVTVFVSELPELSINGDSHIEVIVGTPYIELGANATDDFDGRLDVAIIGEVDTQTVGEYELIYQVTDSQYQQVELKRNVTVVDGLENFTTIWQTDNEGVSENNQIKLEVNPQLNYDYNIDWGDGQVDTNVSSEITHSYAQTGQYKVSITGGFPQIYFSNGPLLSDAKKIESVESWGDNIWLSMKQAFYGTDNIQFNTTDNPNLSMVTDTSYMFADSNFNQDISSWDVSSVLDMNHMFNAAVDFNQDLNSWDVSSVTNMQSMFKHATAFNQELNNWNLSSLTNLAEMFSGASFFNQNINDWDVSSVTSMFNMFTDAYNFNQPLNSWNVSSVTDMHQMFYNAHLFNENISAWDVSSVTTMAFMFYSATDFNQDISLWDVSAVTSMNAMFKESNFNQDISDWDVSSVITMSEMFATAQSFNSNLNDWDVSAVTDMRSMFSGAVSFNSNLSNWDVSLVEQMDAMFFSAIKFDQPLNNWNVSSVGNMQGMFSNAIIFNQDLSSWDVSSVKIMGAGAWYGDTGMFDGATSFDQNLSAWNISNVEEMGKMFKEVTLSTENYNALLLSWSNQIPQTNVEFDGGNSQYTQGSMAEISRTALMDTFSWEITDGGPVVLQ